MRIPRLRARQLVTGALAIVVVAGIAAFGSASANGAPVHPAVSRTDAYTMDASDDVGNQPSGSIYPIWASPDIRICHTTAFCAVSLNPIVGATNYVFVTLRNPGPLGSGASAGVMHVYWTNPSGATNWPVDWTEIGNQALVSGPGTVTNIMIPWTAVPGPGHFCLLSRWVSQTDPMVPETTNTQANTVANNNISWRNVNTVNPSTSTDNSLPFYLGNVAGAPAVNDLGFNVVGAPFTNGTLVVDLGTTLFTRWQQTGAKGTGIAPIGGTKIRIVNPAAARISGLLVNPGERPGITLTFGETAPMQGLSKVSIVQYGPATANALQTALGGVEYDVSDQTTQG